MSVSGMGVAILGAGAEAERLRAMGDDLAADATRPTAAPAAGAASFLGRVVSPTGATAAAFFNVEPIGLTGTEAAGQVGAKANRGFTIAALNVGTKVPTNNLEVIVHFVSFRWVFRHD